MPTFSKSLAQPVRENTLLVGGGWRGFFAPFNAALSVSSSNTSKGPQVVDLQSAGPFNTNSPPSGFFDLGWIKQFKITPTTKIGLVRTGHHGAVRALFRGEVGETIDFQFREATRMSWKLATGCMPINLLKGTTATTVGPISGTGAQAVPIGASGYQSAGLGSQVGVPVLCVPSGSGSLFSAGDYIVADQDYDGVSFGLIGDAGVPIFQGAVTSVDYIRQTSDYVARIVSIATGVVAGQDGLVLNAPFVGGGNSAPPVTPVVTNNPALGPTTGAKIQKIKGFAPREGGTYIAEWSGLFICDMLDGAQIALYYPHVAPAQFKTINPWALEGAGTTDMTGYELDCALNALAFDDPVDGETVVRYSAYYLPKNADAQI